MDSVGTCQAQQAPLRHAKCAIQVELVMKFDDRDKRLKSHVNTDIFFCVCAVEKFTRGRLGDPLASN